eukprot:629340-Pyramimonas_sp.AAC.2
MAGSHVRGCVGVGLLYRGSHWACAPWWARCQSWGGQKGYVPPPGLHYTKGACSATGTGAGSKRGAQKFRLRDWCGQQEQKQIHTQVRGTLLEHHLHPASSLSSLVW